MNIVDELGGRATGERLVNRIAALVEKSGRTKDDPIKLMELCGDHTKSIFEFGLEKILPDALELVHGPGCPVCVLPLGRVDDAISLAEQPDVIFCTYGDAMRAPGSKKTLRDVKAEGADVRTVYSPADALALAIKNPDRFVVFFGLGFETTVHSTALTVLEADAQGVDNFTIFSNHITIAPTIKAILDAPDLHLDGFVGPGHVTTVIGLEPYRFVSEVYEKPFVVSGFEPLDVLQSVSMLVQQIVDGRSDIENQYRRFVPDAGNEASLRAVAEVFELRRFFEWRGLGPVDHSGLQLTKAYEKFDAEKRWTVPANSIADPKACQCGDVLMGAIKPWECKVFGTRCTPTAPMGACMVSSEGACAAYYTYGRLSALPVIEA